MKMDKLQCLRKRQNTSAIKENEETFKRKASYSANPLHASTPKNNYTRHTPGEISQILEENIQVLLAYDDPMDWVHKQISCCRCHFVICPDCKNKGGKWNLIDKVSKTE